MRNEGEYIKSAAVMVWFVSTGHKPKLMLCKRLPSCKRFVGRWGVAGGKVDGDECVIKAAQRELKEETGLYIPKGNLFLIDSHREGVFKCFVFETQIDARRFNEMRNPEPTKHTDWQLFTKEEALALPTLMPALKKILSNS